MPLCHRCIDDDDYTDYPAEQLVNGLCPAHHQQNQQAIQAFNNTIQNAQQQKGLIGGLQERLFNQANLQRPGDLHDGICFGLLLRWMERVIATSEITPENCLQLITANLGDVYTYQRARQGISTASANSFDVPLTRTLTQCGHDHGFIVPYQDINTTFSEFQLNNLAQLIINNLPQDALQVMCILSLDGINAHNLSSHRHGCALFLNIERNTFYLFDPNRGIFWRQIMAVNVNMNMRLCCLNLLFDDLLSRMRGVNDDNTYTRAGAIRVIINAPVLNNAPNNNVAVGQNADAAQANQGCCPNCNIM